MTAGSYSVMLVCPTRRTFCCQGTVDWSMGGKRCGSETTSTLRPSVSTVVPCSGGEAGIASRLFSAEASGMTPAPVRPVFRKLRRFSMDSPNVFPQKSTRCPDLPRSFVAHHENIDHDLSIARPVCNHFDGCSKFDFHPCFQCNAQC